MSKAFDSLSVTLWTGALTADGQSVHGVLSHTLNWGSRARDLLNETWSSDLEFV